MRVFTKFHAALRPLIVVAAVIAAVTGITFAALQSQAAVLKGNTIQTATANLQLSTDGSSYGTSINGFTFSGLLPGGSPVPSSGYTLMIRNTGSSTLAVKLAVADTVANQDNVDLSKVNVLLTPAAGGAPQRISLQDLISSSETGGVALAQLSRLLPNQTYAYTMQLSMDVDALNGPSATISNLDFSFSGAAVN